MKGKPEVVTELYLPSYWVLGDSWGFPGGSVGKETTYNAEDARNEGSIPELGRSPRGGHGSPLQCSCLENPLDWGAWWATVHGLQRVGHVWVADHSTGDSWGSPGGSAVKKLPAIRRPGFDPWVRKIPWERAWQLTLGLLPKESHGQRSLSGCSPQGCKESDTTEQLSMQGQEAVCIKHSPLGTKVTCECQLSTVQAWNSKYVTICTVPSREHGLGPPLC